MSTSRFSSSSTAATAKYPPKPTASRTISPTKAYTETHFKGVVTDFHNANTRKEDIHHARLIQDIDDDKRQFQDEQNTIVSLRNEIENTKDQLTALKNENQRIINQLQALSSSSSSSGISSTDPSNTLRTAERLARQATLNQAKEHSEKAMKLQGTKLQELETILHGKERNIIEKEVGLARKTEHLDKAYDETNNRIQIQRTIASHRAQAELRSASIVAQQVLQHTVESLQNEGNNQLYGTQVYASAKQLHKQAAAQVHDVIHYETTILKAAEEVRQQSVGSKVQAILSLKNNLDQVANDAQAVNARRQAARKARDIAHQNEYDTLLAAGYNPYEVWRARQRDQSLAKEVKEHEEKIATQKLIVAEKVIREDEKVRKFELVAKREKDIDDEQRRTHARPVRDAAITAYLMDKTKDHTDVMDPTGKLIRVEPSGVTILKPGGFGLGNTGITRPDIVAKVASKKQNQNVNVLPHWLPKELNDEDYNDLNNQQSANQESTATSASFALTQRNRTLRKGVTEEDADDEGNEDDDYYSGKRSASSSLRGTMTTAASPPLPPKSLGHTRTIEVRKLSQYEQRLMAEAKARQRSNIVKKQIVLGKEYKGVGFLPSPTVIHFKDFDVHVPMTLKITLTNVSLSFNSFKLLSLPDEIVDLFTIVHTPPGRMSAGLTCVLTITFLPRQNIDIHSQLTVLAHTGPINIPLHCTTKKALPLIREPVLDLGDVILGESTDGYFTVENEGALPLKVTVTKDQSSFLNDNTNNHNNSSNSENENKKNSEDTRPFLQTGMDTNDEDEEQQLRSAVTYSCPIDLPGYGKIKIPVHFAPSLAGIVHVPLSISFDHPSTSPLPLLVKANGIDVPLFVESDIVDLRTCLIGKLYRGILVVRNRGTIALRCEPNIHPGLIDGKILQFHPHTGFVQAKDPLTGEPGRFEFQIKFRPSEDLIERSAIQECRVWEDTSVPGRLDNTALGLAPLLKVPLQVIAPDQVLPVPFLLCARIASPELVIEPDYIDFGSCIVGQAVAYPIRITNTSALPQKFGFIHLPPCFAVSPGDGDGFGLLLPGESTSISVTFSPLGEQDYSSQIVCRTNMNGQYALDVHGKGTKSSLALSHPVIFLAATAVGEIETSTVHLTNTTRDTLDYEIIPPISTDGRSCPVAVSPAIGVLQAGQTVRLQIRYAPTEEDLEAGYAAAQANASTSPLQRARLALATAGESENILNQMGTLSTTDIIPTSGIGSNVASMLQEAAPKAVCDTWQLAIFSRKIVASALLEPVNGSSSSTLSNTKISSIPPPLQTGVVLQVSTVILPRILSASTKSVAFGQVPVGHTETTTVRITNHSDITIDLSPIPLVPAGGFSLVNAPRSLAPGTYHDMVVAFKPTGHRVYTDKLVLGTHSHGPIMNITMSGVGVSPQVVLDPPGCGNIDFGAVCVGDTVTRKITLRNSSGFPLSFNVRQTSITPSLFSATPVPPFYVDPLEGNLAPHGSVTLSVMYVPRHAPSAGLPQNASFIIDVPNQEKNAAQVLLLSGRAFDRAAFVLPVLPSEELTSTSPGAVDSSIVSSKLAGDAESQEVYTLIFPQNTRTNTAAAASTVNTPAVQPSSVKPGTSKGATAPSTTAKPGGGTANNTAVASTEEIVNPGVIKEMIVSCINRAEQNPTGNSAQQQLPTSFIVNLPSTLNQGPGLAESSGRTHFFSVDVTQGNITPGNKQIIKFKFLPPEIGTESSTPTNNKKNTAMSVGEWHEVDAKIILKGGYVVPGANDERSITVRLRAYVPSSKK